MTVLIEKRDSVCLNTCIGPVKVKDLKEARERFLATQSSENMAASDYNFRESGNIIENGNVIARISYNGKVWDNDDNEIEVA